MARRGGAPWEIHDLVFQALAQFLRVQEVVSKGQMGLRPPEEGTATPQPGSLPGPTRFEVLVEPGVSPTVLTGKGGQAQAFPAP